MMLRPAAFALLLLASGASAYDTKTSGGGGHTATSIGGRATFYKPQDADHGLWAPGVQLRLHASRGYSTELSADFTHHSIGQTTIKVVPIQASLLGYFYPDSSLSPYLIAGIGWYYTRVLDASPHSENRWGPHAGLGMSILA